MRFIELSGKTLRRVVTDGELTHADLAKLGIGDETIVRVNPQGDIEVRRKDRWDVIGGLLGNFEHRIQRETGLDWA